MTNIKHSLAVMQPYFFPYIGYFQLIKAVDRFVIYDDVNFIKQGWIARNRILLNGTEHMVSLQLAGASSFKLINEIGVGDNADKLLKTVYQAYCKASFFDQCFPVVQKILKNEEKNLAAFLFALIKSVCDYLGIKTELILSSAISKDNELKGQDKVLSICEALKAATYVNTSAGRQLYSREAFAERGLNLLFLDPLPVTYKQFCHEFVPGLSIIDVMMFNAPDTIAEYLGRYELT